VPASPTERSIAASIAAHVKWAKTDPVEGTSRAREVFLSTFELQADPEGALDPVERARRAEHLRKAHFKRLALRSAKVRAARKVAG
jgi:hypothetical protein